MSAAHTRPTVSLEDFLEMKPAEGEWLEWCAGLVYAMSGGSPEHSRLCARIVALFDGLFGDECTIFDGKADLWIEAAAFYGQADVSVVCGAVHSLTVKKAGRTLGEAITNAVVVVEVLSPSTEGRDRGEKFEAYKQMTSLREYALVSQDERRVEVRRRSDVGWSCDVAEDGGTVRLRGREIAVAAFYARV